MLSNIRDKMDSKKYWTKQVGKEKIRKNNDIHLNQTIYKIGCSVLGNTPIKRSTVLKSAKQKQKRPYYLLLETHFYKYNSHMKTEEW